jgi:hypothetical protein
MSDYSENVRDQAVAGLTSWTNQLRAESLADQMGEIGIRESSRLAQQAQAFEEACAEIGWIRGRLAPEHILGNPNTKHGEIAEICEVGIRNAKSLLEQEAPIAKLLDQGIDRFGPVDYQIGDINVQSKFINGTTGNGDLAKILEHMRKYQDFPKGSSNIYHIPKDHYEKLGQIINGQAGGEFSEKSLRAIHEKVQEIEKLSGRPFDEIVKPATLKYPDVQKGALDQTLTKQTDDLSSRNEEINARTKHDADAERQAVNAAHAPSWSEAGKYAGVAAAFAATMSAGIAIYKKHKQGIKLQDFTAEDWKAVGLDSVKGGVKGGISGLSIYGLTNLCNTPAPLAGAFVSTTFGVARLVRSYRRGETSEDEFFEQGTVLCFDAGAAALGATIGQALIPVPVLGAVIGTIAAKVFADLAKDFMKDKSKALEMRLNNFYAETMSKIDAAYQNTVQRILEQYERLGSLTAMAFDLQKNVMLRLEKSVELAEEYGVPNGMILRSSGDVDAFIMS